MCGVCGCSHQGEHHHDHDHDHDHHHHDHHHHEGPAGHAHDLVRIEKDILATNIPTVQINTGRGCHLDAHMVGHALDSLPLKRNSILFVENVGNLVCP